jgi:rRNA maturation endonuclease Nob1
LWGNALRFLLSTLSLLAVGGSCFFVYRAKQEIKEARLKAIIAEAIESRALKVAVDTQEYLEICTNLLDKQRDAKVQDIP